MPPASRAKAKPGRARREKEGSASVSPREAVATQAPPEARDDFGGAPLVEIRGISKTYPTFHLQDVNLTVPQGSVVGFVGANGAGKTTTIRCLLGLANPDSGSVKLFGEDFNMGAGSGLTHAIRGKLGCVFDTLPFLPDFNLNDLIRIFSAAYKTWDQNAFDRTCQALELGEFKKVEDLSRGMGMKLQLACALAHHPTLLVLDEATAGLDPFARDSLLDLLRVWLSRDPRRGILLSSHITTDLENLADRVVGIDHGKITFDLDKESVTKVMGVAQLTDEQVRQVLQSGRYPSGSLKARRHALAIQVLVPDRRQFQEWFPGMDIIPASIDDYVIISGRGDVL